MMNPLDKKFLNVSKISQEVSDLIQSTPANEEAISELERNNFNTHYPVLITPENKMFQAFNYRKGSKTYQIPESKPIALYFNSARFYANHAQQSKKKLFDELDSPDQNVYRLQDAFAVFYTNAFISATSLFNSLEAFINGLIPSDFSYVKESDKKTETYNQFQTQKHIQFEEKIKIVIPKIFKEKMKEAVFHQKQGHKWESIKKLKEFRDEIVHTKSYKMTSPNHYEELFSSSLDFDFEKALEHTKDYINFYESNLIE